MPFNILPDGTFPEIGGRYDIGIATRDGSSLLCANKNAQPVPTSRMAYMMSIDRRPSQFESSGRVKTMREATELQEKDRLVQLGTSTSIDREFDQWVQNTQGDWAGGLGQRVYGQNNIVDQYFDGEGLLWPLNDWVPQKALRGPTQPIPPPAAAGAAAADSGTETAAPGGSAAVTAAAAVLASFKASGGTPALVGVKGAYTSGTNTAVAPPFGQATGAGHLLTAKVGGQRSSESGPASMGETSAATSSFDFSAVNSDNVIGTAATFVVPAGGLTIKQIFAYMGGHTSPVNTRLCVWNAGTGALIVDSALFTAGTGRALQGQNVTPTFVAAGTSIRIGFWRQQSQNAEWGVAASGSFNYATNQPSDGTQPGNGCVGPYVCGHIQAYITYTTGTTSDIVQSNAGPAPGWSKIKEQNSPDGTQQIQIWAKPNCGAGETAPAFAAAAGASPMHAQCEEWTNIALTSPTDQSVGVTSSLQSSITATNPGVDTVFGDLVLMAVRWQLNGAATCGFTDLLNNGMATVQLGDSGAGSLVNHTAFTYGIVPTGAATFTTWALNGTAGGNVEGLGMGYAVCYRDNQGPPGHWHVAFFAGDAVYDVDIGVNTGNQQGPLHMQVAAGYVWVLFSNYPNANTLRVFMLGCNYGSNAFTQLRSDALPAVAGTSGFGGLIAASYVGGKLYVGILQSDQNVQPGAPAANRNALFVGDYSAGVGSVPSGLAAAAVVFPFERGFKEVDLTWQGSNLIVAIGDGLNAYIYQLASPFTTVVTQAVIPGIANALLCAVGPVLFIVGWTPGPNGINRMNLYTLNGNTLTELPFTPIAPFVDSVTSPTAFGSYALWAISYQTPGGPVGQKTITVYAFDAVRDRLFRALTYTDPLWTGSDVFGHDAIALYGVSSRTLAAGVTYQSQLGLAIFSGFLSNNAESAREFCWGVIPVTPAPAFKGLLQLGVDIISGLFDFTAATNKLFRATVSHFIGGLVPGQTSPSVTLNAWFDQDPNRLSAVPDFTSNSGTAPNPLPSQLDLNLFTNRVARKLVYEVISSGGGFDIVSNSWLNAPKITDVIVQAATGWVWDMALDLSPTVGVNGQGQQEYAYTHQSPTDATSLSYDHVVAYNFLKKLWREKGGECQLYLPNGDTYPALIQLLAFESPKPIAGIGRSDMESTWQVFALIKIREDI